jgi:hypothetical protein
MDCWESSFRSKLENVAGVNCSLKTETSSKLITSPRVAREEERNWVTNVHCIDIAMINDTHGVSTVPMTRARSLRSRMTLTCHVRF